METSSNFSKNFHCKTCKALNNFYPRNKKLTENQLAIEETKKLYQKYYENPKPFFLSQLKTDILNIFLDNYNFSDITVINKILSKYYFLNI